MLHTVLFLLIAIIFICLTVSRNLKTTLCKITSDSKLQLDKNTKEIEKIIPVVKGLESEVQSFDLLVGDSLKHPQVEKSHNKLCTDEFGVYDGMIVRFDQIKGVYFRNHNSSCCYIRYGESRFEIYSKDAIINLLEDIKNRCSVTSSINEINKMILFAKSEGDLNTLKE